MSLGGYKFAGYKCIKGSGMSDAEWALRIHKTRIKAFLEANTRAATGWEFDLNGGKIDYDSTYTGVIYDLGGDGLNLVTYFRYGTYPVDAKYYMIASLFNWTCSTPTSPQIAISTNGPITSSMFNGFGGYRVNSFSLFHAVSYDPFPWDCLLKSSDNYPNRAISLVPICGYCIPSSSPSCTTSQSNTYFKTDKMYFGYALRDLDIIHLSVPDDNILSENRYQYIRTSLLGFNSLTLSSPNDSSNIYGICLSAPYSNEVAGSIWNDSVLYLNETLNDSFTRYAIEGMESCLILSRSNKAFFNGVVNAYPFETVSLTTNGMRGYAPFLNSDGISSKGTFNIELLACNGARNYSSFSEWSSIANGNYLTVLVYRMQTTLTSPQTTYYVGWDASNPDILDESSWNEFVG